MSLSPDPNPVAPDLAGPMRRTTSWQSRLLSICFVIFTFEVGLFLVVVPWMDETWGLNSFPDLVPVLQNVWIDPYFRGAITGLGLVNVYIAVREIFRLLRRS